jgi:hypothetical protein
MKLVPQTTEAMSNSDQCPEQLFSSIRSQALRFVKWAEIT